ncbi:MAG: redoxin domain-containing protein [Bacteroidetes bacterium]|nr:redoxin domain-containing protein [Bacteroidota bacterium]
MKSIVSILSLLSLSLVLCSELSAQTAATYDTAYGKRIDAAWEEIRAFQTEVQKDSSLPDPQRRFAQEFMSYYDEHPGTSTGHKAVLTAFMMWANLADFASVRVAMDRIPLDSELWSPLLNSIEVAYANAGRWSTIWQLLDTLSHSVTHPKSLAEVLLELGDENLSVSRDSLARYYYTQVLSIDADTNQKTRASLGIYETDSLIVGSIAPDINGVSVQGRQVRLSGLRGTNVLVEFTATWCGPCQSEIPFLREAYANSARKNLSLIAVSLDDSTATVLRYLDEKGIPWPHILAPEKHDNLITRSYNVQGIPRIFLIDSSGRIVHKHLRGKEIAIAIDKLSSE